MPAPRCSPATVTKLAVASAAICLVNIASGAAVRLSDSGLGCPDWPDCSRSSLTPPDSLHPIIEFGNRMVVVVLVVVAAVTFVAAILRAPKRRDLSWLAGGLILGILGEAVIGGFVVYSKLNPYVVMVHFLVGMALLSDAVVLVLRSRMGPERGSPATSPQVKRLAQTVVIMLGMAVVAGTAATGAGPHAGGKGAKRIPVPLDDVVRTHSGIVWLTGAALLVLLWQMAKTATPKYVPVAPNVTPARATIPATPKRVQDRFRWLLVAMAGQGILGYVQYFSHLPAVLVGIHVVGASVVWTTALWALFGLVDREPLDRETEASIEYVASEVGVRDRLGTAGGLP